MLRLGFRWMSRWLLRGFKYPAQICIKCSFILKADCLPIKVDNYESVDLDFLSRHSSQSNEVDWSRQIVNLS